MTKWIKWCCGGCVALLLFAGLVAFFGLRWAKSKPTNWTAEASIEIAAPSADVLSLLEDLRRWSEWSRFERDTDTAIDREFGGARRGAGATVLWTKARGGSDTPWALGKLELDAVSPTGLEYTSWHYGSLRLASSHAHGLVSRSTHVELGGIDEDFRVPGTIRIEPTEQGCRVSWRESVELGDKLLARLYAVTVVELAQRAHQALIEGSLEGLKDRVELR
ncbi:MAG: hypothetical protein FJ298_04460 [Planctomycetes bacterium]|nr:hypothetical protein [Planctomycetota bacterium]